VTETRSPKVEPSATVVVDRFHNLAMAQVALQMLHAEGLEAWLLDEQTLGVSWWLGPAIGGARLMVRPADAAEARRLLASTTAEMPPELEPLDPAEEAAFARRSRFRKRAIGVAVLLLMVHPLIALAGLALALGSSRRRGPGST
jgi:hypothetical protein